MGQKVHPIGMRLGIIRDQDSKWYASSANFANTVQEDFKIRKLVKKRLAKASISKIKIERLANIARLTILSARPGAVIGKNGEDIAKLKDEMKSIIKTPVNINIEEIKRPEIDAFLVATGIAQQLVRRVMFRRAMKRAVTTAMKVGAKGIKVCVSGRLGGAEIARSEWYKEGRVPLHTLRADIDYAIAEANTTYGIIGVKVWIYKGEVTENAS